MHTRRTISLDPEAHERVDRLREFYGKHACTSNVTRRALALLDEHLKQATGNPLQEAAERAALTRHLATPGRINRGGAAAAGVGGRD